MGVGAMGITVCTGVVCTGKNRFTPEADNRGGKSPKSGDTRAALDFFSVQCWLFVGDLCGDALGIFGGARHLRSKSACSCEALPNHPRSTWVVPRKIVSSTYQFVTTSTIARAALAPGPGTSPNSSCPEGLGSSPPQAAEVLPVESSKPAHQLKSYPPEPPQNRFLRSFGCDTTPGSQS